MILDTSLPAPRPSWQSTASLLTWQALALLATGLALPSLLAASLVRPRLRRGLGERLGGAPAPPSGTTWFHAASVGELRAFEPLARELRSRRLDLSLALSVTTPTGREAAKSLSGLLAVPPFHPPVDCAPALARALGRLRPRALVLVETEIWPGLLDACRRRGIVTALVSGRFSPRHFPGYRRARPLFAPALQSLALLAMRTEEDAERALALGAPRQRIHVTGSLKFDGAGAGAAAPELPWARAAGLTEGPWLALASTAEGEEEALLSAFKGLRGEHPDLRALLAPRRSERFDAVAALVERAGLPLVRRSRIDEAPRGVPPGGVLLLDTLGELARTYRHVALVFVGGSLVPHGGQNLLEPAAAGCPVLHGPHVDNFRDAEEALVREGGSLRVDSDTFGPTCARLLRDPEERRRRGLSALHAVQGNRGAAARTADLLLPLLDSVRGGTP